MSKEPLSKKQICCKSIEEQMTEFQKKNHDNICNIKVIQKKKHDKNESILSPICISETDINDNVASNNSEDYPWPKGAICIAGDSFISGLQQGLLPRKHKVNSFDTAGLSLALTDPLT